MEPGKLRHNVELQRATIAAPTASGQRKPGYTTYATVWAGFQAQSSYTEDANLGGKRAAQVRTLVVMRQRSDVVPTDRIVWDDGRIFDVIGLLNTFEATDEMVLACVQVIS